MNLATNYLGMTLKNPIVASSSPLSHNCRQHTPPGRRRRSRRGHVFAV